MVSALNWQVGDLVQMAALPDLEQRLDLQGPDCLLLTLMHVPSRPNSSDMAREIGKGMPLLRILPQLGQQQGVGQQRLQN